MNKLLNTLSEDNITPDPGILNNMNSFCTKKITSESCQKFYQSLRESNENELFVCPYGFNCIKSFNNIYNCLLVKDKFNTKKVKPKKDLEQRVFSYAEISGLIELTNEYESKENDLEFAFRNMSDFLHDITKANKMIESKYRNISKKGLTRKDASYFESIYHLSDFITKRIELYRLVSNPAIIAVGKSRIRDAFKLWDIYRYMFNDLRNESNIIIDMHTYNADCVETKDSSTTFYANDAITILPFLLLDNAIKYSENNSIIKISFFQNNGFLEKIIMESTPSYIITEDPNNFFIRGYRSLNNTSKSSGSGLGLNIVKQICEYNDIEIKLELSLDVIGNQLFIVKMFFNTGK